ncbi:MAG: DegT/DnrJ/EryC1/StrS aminotransferase family protein [Candidatus Calescibacterium sp.]|nr:DegT/DnrJ/EryC1/StrS aminotransferase family protein [Candidatus Calescibacterium sp.]MDW8133374.1 DegT/DnrJ/EryC1/StrS aminotransferase family protein [Candidatus Calescibacterium sp.]
MYPIPHSKPYLDKKDIESVRQTILSKNIANNGKSQEFKNLLSKYLHKEYVELYSSGTTAFYEILLALEIKQDDEILIPAYICESVYKAVKKSKAKPVFYDNDENYPWITSYKQIEKKLSYNTKAILINHTFGIQYSIEEILKIKSIGKILIEDCAHFIPNKEKDRKISNIFDISFYSFNATKLLTTGEGGAIATNNKELFSKIIENKIDPGMPDLNCSLGISQIKKLPFFLEKREEIANIYLEKLETSMTKEIKKYESIYFRFPIIVKDQEKFLSSKRVCYRKGVDTLLHKKYEKSTELKNVENIFKKTISIPIYPSLTKKEIKIIIEETLRIYGS